MNYYYFIGSQEKPEFQIYEKLRDQIFSRFNQNWDFERKLTMTTDLGSIEDDTLDILTLRNGSPKYLSRNAYK